MLFDHTYHPDHLGSAAWITDKYGLSVQYMMYAPYGELLLNQQAGTYDERFKFTGKERDEETGYDYFGARYYLPIISIFGSVDPLANKYIYNSPYVYCEGNPIKYIDPDGLEKLIALAPDIARNQTLLKGANSFKDDAHVIHIWAHGTSEKIEFYIKGSSSMMEVSAGTTHNLAAYLSSNSELYAETEGHPAMIVLHSCETGKGENSIAQQISADENFANVLIVAPTENIAVDGNSNQELGAMKTQPNGDSNFPLFDENGNILYGAWKIFLNGEVVNSFSGSSSPNFSNPQEQLERYNNSENSSGI